MIHSKIDRENYQILSEIQVGQTIGTDRLGRVYIINKQSFVTNLVQEIFQNQKKIRQIVQGFIIEKLQEKKFHDIMQGRDAYLALLNQFALNQLSVEQRASVAFDYYNQRYRDLVKLGEEPWLAECQIVFEMLDDPNIPASFKQDIAPEVYESGVFLKDRAGKKIAFQEEHSTPQRI